VTVLLINWQRRLPQSFACCRFPDKEADSVESVVKLSLPPDHPVVALISKTFWCLRYRVGVMAVIMLKRPS